MRKLILVAILALAIRIPAIAEERVYGTAHEILSFTDSSATRTVRFDVHEDVEDPKLEITCRIRRGAINFKVTRPDGGVQAELRTGSVIEVELEPETLRRHPGTWQVEITTRRATGKYDVRYTARPGER